MRRILSVVAFSFVVATPASTDAGPISFVTSGRAGVIWNFGAAMTFNSQPLTDSSWSLIGGDTYTPAPGNSGVASWTLTNVVTPFSISDDGRASVVTTVLPLSGLFAQITGFSTAAFSLTDPMMFVYDAFATELSDTPLLSETSVRFAGPDGVISHIVSTPFSFGSAHLEGILEPGDYSINTFFNGQTLNVSTLNTYSFDLSLAPVAVPEPTSLLLLATGCIGFANRVRCRQKESSLNRSA